MTKKSSAQSATKKSAKQDDDMAFLMEMQKQNEKAVEKKKTEEKKKVQQNPSSSTTSSVAPQPKSYPNEQTQPEPTVPIRYLFKNNKFPEGENMEYTQDFNRFRSSSKEEQQKEELFDKIYQEARQAAEVHRTARKWFQGYVKPGMKVIDAAEAFENKARELIEDNKLNAGLAFPLGCSMNNCAAHYTPNAGDETVITADDIIKFDLGLHINGRIIDCAFTMYWDDKFKPLAMAAKDATNTGIKTAGIDVRMSDIGAAIQEVMESYEVELNGKTYPVKCVRNLNGHSVERYRIHAGKTVPIVRNNDQTKMEENEFFAIETFGSTGKGYVEHEGVCSHYMRDFFKKINPTDLKTQKARELLKVIEDNFSTLAFCRRYLDRLGEEKYMVALKSLVNAGVVNEYPPLCDVKGCYTSQYEHTIVLKPTRKEVISRGDDY
ncbi:hypothetical protein C9374_008465 [Naegleria lovaniensis]|uniref:Methionine aminopeptidase 2 n=1 Tax=Naegleria lovaniensis TaxID=51637 RepID=A0AA88GF65_NAELO|nr:uncharacterized protein C9374_008465 [Naegleria lovaniensis]KAG2378322.1 hypothetical protein C9374_008465 [Naegleria lovaniensis]